MTVAKAIDWFFRGKDGRIYIIQFPSMLLSGWFVFMIVSNFVQEEPTKTGFSDLSFAFLAIWSYLEITDGSSRFRRVLGAVVAMLMIYNLFR